MRWILVERCMVIPGVVIGATIDAVAAAIAAIFQLLRLTFLNNVGRYRDILWLGIFASHIEYIDANCYCYGRR